LIDQQGRMDKIPKTAAALKARLQALTRQLVPQLGGGATLACLRTDGTASSTYGPAHLIGGGEGGVGAEQHLAFFGGGGAGITDMA
jgi:hypothetical protein